MKIKIQHNYYRELTNKILSYLQTRYRVDTGFISNDRRFALDFCTIVFITNDRFDSNCNILTRLEFYGKENQEKSIKLAEELEKEFNLDIEVLGHT